jgi:DNA-binding XRE family transcriptional regulator
MVARGRIYGHDVYWDAESECYRWSDDEQPAGKHWGGEDRPCPQCEQPPTPEGYDACLGYIHGVYSACCGHGRETGSIHWGPSVGKTVLLHQRETAGLTLREVAPKVGISISYLSVLERGENGDISLRLARRIADFYGVSVDCVFPREETARRTAREKVA